MRITLLIMALCTTVLASAGEPPPGSRDGEVRVITDSEFVAWDAVSSAWLSPEDFWAAYAGRGAGRNWPSSSEYPSYSAVNEHDTFLVLTPQGPCLMYFFHSRWRRANDVRRWSEEFNAYSGCPYVFD
jgi:hypothetical protein